MSYNNSLQINNLDLHGILDAVNALPDAGSGGDVELCTVTAHIPRDTGFLVTTQWSGDCAVSTFSQFPITDAEFVCPKNSWVILYAPDNQGWSFEGGVEYWGETWDYQTIFGWVTGDGHIELYQY